MVTTGIQRGKYYLRVAISHSTEQVRFTVDESRNLRETEGLIHTTAVRWIQDLEIKVRRSLGRVAVQGP